MAAESEADLLDSAEELRSVLGPLVRQMRRHDAGRFTPTQLSVLGAIRRAGPISIGDLATMERLAPPTVSKLVAILEEAGMIERLSDRVDRRVSRVRVSQAGTEWIENVRERVNDRLRSRMAVLHPDELLTLQLAVPVLRHLADLLSEDS